MAPNIPTSLLILAVGLGITFYQRAFKPVYYSTLGYDRNYNLTGTPGQPALKCEKLDASLGLEGCEDMWLHEPTGYLYMACSSAESRKHWMPAVDHLNITGRGTTDKLYLLDTRGSGPISTRLHAIALPLPAMPNGDTSLSLHGLSIRPTPDGKSLSFLLVNHRPSFDQATNTLLDEEKMVKAGTNSTVEVFEGAVGARSLRHVRTWSGGALQTVNRVAFVGTQGGDFVFSNDHSGKVGMRRQLDIFIGGGTLGYCSSTSGTCTILKTPSFAVPNGLILGADGLLYVPNTVSGLLDIFALPSPLPSTPPKSLQKIGSLTLPYPIDNLSLDADGDIYAACFPELHLLFKSQSEPWRYASPTVVVRVRKVGGWAEKKEVEETMGEYVVEEVGGDAEAGASTVVHDAVSGKLWMGGPFVPWTTVCEVGK